MVNEHDLHKAMAVADVPHMYRHVLRVLRMREAMNREGLPAWPSYSRLVDDTGLSRPSIAKAVKWCEATGWLDVERGKAGKVSNRYRVRIPACPSVDKSAGGVNPANYGSKRRLLEEGTEEGSKTPTIANAMVAPSGASANPEHDADVCPPINVHCADYCRQIGADPARAWEQFCGEVLCETDLWDEPWSVKASTAFKGWTKRNAHRLDA